MSKLRKKDYETALEPMRLELNNLARWLRHTGRRMVVLFEGREAAGKGGCIHAISETLNPRQVHIVALAAPSEREGTQWYFQRYVEHLPAAGELVLFDRSWYNRAGVEKVMGFCTAAEYEQFLQQAPVFEKLLTDAGTVGDRAALMVSSTRDAMPAGLFDSHGRRRNPKRTGIADAAPESRGRV